MGERSARRRELRDLTGRWQHANQQANRALAKKRVEVKHKKKLTESEVLLLKAAEEKLTRSFQRRQVRDIKREERNKRYYVNGLNGPRAVARRRRQMGLAA
jgi:hypothetical protein